MTINITLRDVNESDLTIFYEQQLEPEATQMAALPSRDQEAFMAHWTNNVMRNENGVVRTVLFDGQVAGNIVSWEQSGHWEVAYWLGKEYWGKGIATQALSEFLQIVNHRPLFAHVVKHNIASQRVLQKCGFAILSEEKFVEDGTEIEEFIMKLE